MVAVQAAAGLSTAEVATLSGNAFEIAWLSEADKSEYVAAVDGYELSPR